MTKNINLSLLASTFICTFTASTIQAAPPNLTGSWTGTGTGTQTGCSDTALNGTLTGSTNFNFSNINGSQFNIGLINNHEAETFNLSGQGSFQNDTNIVASNLAGTSTSGGDVEYSLSGTVINDQIEFSGSGRNGTCQYSYNGQAARDVSFVFGGSSGDTGAEIPLGGVIPGTKTIIPEGAGGSLVTNNHVSLARAVIHTNDVIRNRIQNVLRLNLRGGLAKRYPNPNTGIAAGDGLSNLSIWSSIDQSNFENNFSRTKYDGKTRSILVGVDYSFTDNIVAGMALGYEKSDIDTDFNFGQMDSTGISFSPYLGITFSETWSADVALGYTNLDHDQYRLQAGTRIDSNVDSVRWFISSNLNGNWQLDQMLLSLHGGFIHAENTDDAYTESNNIRVRSQKSSITTLNIGGDVAYAIGDFEPFLSVTYNRDTTDTVTTLSTGSQPSDDRDDFMVGLGTRFFHNSGLSLNAELSKRLGRKNTKETNFTLSALWPF